jgi:hypothetical protein
MRKAIGAAGLLAVMVTGIVSVALHARGGNVRAPATQPDTETVLVTHRVQAGKQNAYLTLLAKQWAALSKHHLVQDRPHIVLRGEDEKGKPYFVEILAWVSHEAPDNVPPDVQAIWDAMGKLVENRDGHRGIEFPEVHEVELPKAN